MFVGTDSPQEINVLMLYRQYGDTESMSIIASCVYKMIKRKRIGVYSTFDILLKCCNGTHSKLIKLSRGNDTSLPLTVEATQLM